MERHLSDMASGSTWHPLPPFPDLPSLMILPKFSASSYTLHVTDLANVWVETLDRRGILLRSLQEDTSIDLSDGDPDQWAVFLSKLNTAFDPTSPDHHSTSLSLAASSPERTSAVEGGLILHVTCVLPRPLKPLRWPVYLTKCPPASLASELVLPLIQAQHERNLEIQDLIARLQEKDAVIMKLVDKLEAMHTGLEHVFNSLSGKRKPSRAAAEEKVKGLAVFSESDWRPRINAKRELVRDVPSLIRKVFIESGLHCNTDADVGASHRLNDWWTKLDSTQVAAIKPQNETPKKTPAGSLQTTKGAVEKNDDDFQVQVTPPHLQSQGRTISHSKTADDTTDEDDSSAEIPDSHPAPSPEKPRTRIGSVGGRKISNKDDSPSQSSRTVPAEDDDTVSESDQEPVRSKSPKRMNPRLGTIGRSKEPSPPPAKSPSPAPPPPKDDDDETASGSDDSEDEPPKSRSRPPPAPAPRNKGGLGRIGGNPKSRTTPEPTEAPRASTPKAGSSKATASPAKPAGRKLGVIGKKPESDGKRLRSETPEEAAAEPETEEQRTERRRAELAKELERKAAAPTKKKRRF
ncbi:XLF-domain-containing protein [Hypoxylon rubiginosum]|uniref:XLF-domain-containing protein n=1 Tax=Hypoxylon rubiginosum TaxID=110542 RepID=A0ACB9ZET2_9PEZI|nr:XLF-domain-containing protein [Hypoxylon rubiginosum]